VTPLGGRVSVGQWLGVRHPLSPLQPLQPAAPAALTALAALTHYALTGLYDRLAGPLSFRRADVCLHAWLGALLFRRRHRQVRCVLRCVCGVFAVCLRRVCGVCAVCVRCVYGVFTVSLVLRPAGPRPNQKFNQRMWCSAEAEGRQGGWGVGGGGGSSQHSNPDWVGRLQSL
jgi:hypothetical protein